MMQTLFLAIALFATVAMICLAATRAWRGWLDYKRLELASRRDDDRAPDADVGVRIELAGVRERLKKLEEIASGVEL